ncbi:MAG: hypothetical protein JWM81_745 [Candidatus Saccharibacteria bacterium]|nr:hypothetical protein [Candidatus Saccharibacteria bacterium]
MFEKLVSALPYNPSLIHQLGFYSKRLRQEQAIRRFGLIFILLAFFIQFFAVISPPQQSVAASPNDLINNGISSAADAANHCRNNALEGYGDIMKNYGISCDAIAAAPTVTIKSTDYNRNLYSMGHNPYGKAGETPVNVFGKTLYVRYLWSWDTHASSSYKALKVTVGATTYFILYNCGNLTSIGLPQPVPQPVPCPYNSAIFTGDAACVPPPPPACPQDHSIPATDALCKACPQDTTILKKNPLCVQCLNPRYPNVLNSSPDCKEVCKLDNSLDTDNKLCKVCEYKADILQSSPDCKACDKSANSTDVSSCIYVRKSAANLTQGLADATTRKAAAGDKIDYTLYAVNGSKADVKDYVFQESINDILDYANILDLHGGTKDSDGLVTWPAVTIKPGQTVMQRVSVQVMQVIPQTPRSSSDLGHFDLVMSNTYGNTVEIGLPASPPKVVEAVAGTELPHTGPGSSMIVAGMIAVFAAYFFARTRLLAQETKLVMQENSNGGL